MRGRDVWILLIDWQNPYTRFLWGGLLLVCGFLLELAKLAAWAWWS